MQQTRDSLGRAALAGSLVGGYGAPPINGTANHSEPEDVKRWRMDLAAIAEAQRQLNTASAKAPARIGSPEIDAARLFRAERLSKRHTAGVATPALAAVILWAVLAW